MANYKDAFLFVAIMVSLSSVFFLVVGIFGFNVFNLAFWGGMLLLWWGTYTYLRTGKAFSFWGSFLLINLFWWPLLVQTSRRIWFVIENGGMERADGLGSPLAFLIGLIGEQIFFLPLSVAMIAGALAIRESRKVFRPPAESAG